MSTGLVRALYEGQLDIIGDVHGELEALQSLLERLGYSPAGVHAAGRRLVFVGDLCDRGPDSPGVIRLVRDFVEAGRAQYVIGNHELNLVLGKRKTENRWFYGGQEPEFGWCAPLPDTERSDVLAFLSSLPVALESAELRVVHAAWRAQDIEACRVFRGNVREAHDEFARAARDAPGSAEIQRQGIDEESHYAEALKDRFQRPPFLAALARYKEHRQMSNPISVITSGVERVTENPFHAGHEWRFVARERWWRTYFDEPKVIFGHYWRWWNPAIQTRLSKGEPNVFDGEAPCGWHKNEHGRQVAFCVDYSIGAKYKERHAGKTGGFHARLGAVRWPEGDVVFNEADPM